ncbi:MAG: ChuX/HutX family heme-like substrate-binding protein [Gemmataceae bacterium]
MTTILSPEQAEAIRAELRDNPTQMTLQLARSAGVPEAEIVRLFPDHHGTELDISRWQEIFTSLAELGKVHVIVSNAAATCEVVGEFGGLSVWGEFFNVQTSSMDLHIRWPQLGSVFALEKPGPKDGSRTLSLQFFDRKGDSALKVFLNFAGKPTAQRLEQFHSLRQEFRRKG